MTMLDHAILKTEEGIKVRDHVGPRHLEDRGGHQGT